MVSAKAGIEPALADKEFLKGKSKIFVKKSLTSPLKTSLNWIGSIPIQFK